MSDAELTYGSLSIDHSEQMKEIGELGLDIWKRLVSDILACNHMQSGSDIVCVRNRDTIFNLIKNWN